MKFSKFPALLVTFALFFSVGSIPAVATTIPRLGLRVSGTAIFAFFQKGVLIDPIGCLDVLDRASAIRQADIFGYIDLNSSSLVVNSCPD